MAEVEKEIERGNCPDCGSERADKKQSVLKEYRSLEYDSDTEFSILECRGCGRCYFKQSHTNSEDYFHYYCEYEQKEVQEYQEHVDYWPPPSKRTKPAWFDDLILFDHDLHRLLGDVYTALDNNLDVLAAIGMRTVFDRSSELLKIHPNKSFAQKIATLVDQGDITKNEGPLLVAVVDAGSAAAHRGWRPKPSELNAMMTILESFLHRTFLLEHVGKSLAKKVPPRPS